MIKKNIRLRDFWILLLAFVISRLIVISLGIRMNIGPLYAYWQYLDLETLRHHLLRGVWFDHAQPPVFNLFLGLMLKVFGSRSLLAFAVSFKIISLINGLLLMSIVRKITHSPFLPLLLSLAYLLSPATLIYECELFYTSFISLLLLISVYFLIRIPGKSSWSNTIGFFLPLVLLGLTRSVYHILWLSAVAGVFLFYFRTKPVFYKILTAGILSLLLLGSWYIKNKILFDKLSVSTWIGMTLARNVFHDNEIKDSSRIEAYGSFSRISLYKKFIDPQFEKKFEGLNDRDLLQEMKNDSFINENNVNYIPVSDLYQKASLARIRSKPMAYLENVLQSAIIYFTPATIYSLALDRAAKIRTYDLVYSFNLSHFARGKQQRRIALTVSAIPKLLIYAFVFFIIIRQALRIRSISCWNVFILLTIGFVFAISSLFEHYENMRFRFETEPLFLILAAQAISILRTRRNRYIKEQPE
ncbi:MAG: hypothetical protein Q8918_11085 [Bacteroidota bacterium]|nr:hypothetical protein [Bacteroidota bacterium]